MSKSKTKNTVKPVNTDTVVENNNVTVEVTPEVTTVENNIPKGTFFKNCTGSKQQISINGKNYTVLTGDIVCIPVEDVEEFKRVCEGAWFPVEYQIELPL